MADAGITRRRLLITAAGITALATVWFAASELPPVARLWTAALMVVLPAMMMLQARELRAGMRVPRIAMYASTVLSLWLMALATGAVTIAAGFALADLDLVPVPWRTAVLWAAGATLAGELLIILGWTAGLRGSDTLRDLLPVTRRERAIFLVVAITAGVCEEVVFRGFLLMALTAATQSVAAGIVLAALAFGVVHAYQDAGGAASAALLGVILTVPVLATGSLYPSIAAHVAIDIIGGWWLGPALMRRE